VFTYVRVYAGPDGESHFGEVTIDTVTTEVFPGLTRMDVAAPIPTASLIIIRVPREALAAGWRRPPRRQFVTFAAEAEVEVSDGEVRRIPAGIPVLFEDTTGKGHATRLLAEGETVALFLPLVD
jgi:hypothetical protein